MKKVVILLLLQSISCPVFAQFEAADHLQISMVPAISFNSSSGTFTYLYQVISASTSVQLLSKLHLTTLDADTDDGGTILRIFSPTNLTTWQEGTGEDIRLGAYTVRWYPAEKTTQDDLLHPHPPSQALRPGQSLVNLGMISNFLPGPTTFYAQGWVKPPTQEEIDSKLGLSPADEPSGKQLRSVYPGARSIADNSFHGPAISPMQAPAALSNPDLIDRLISLKHQTVSLDWLRGDELVKELDEKLDQAKKALAEGKPFKARKKLEQFIRKLEEQRKEQLERQHEASEKGREERAEHSADDKTFINDNAFFLLKPNAEFIISKLPSKPKDQDEDRGAGKNSDD